MRHLICLLAEEEGATAIEYAFIASLISIVIVSAAGVMGNSLITIFNNVATGFGR